MRRKSDGGEEPITRINVVPLVDIFLVLLIIFMVTAKVFVEEAQKLAAIPVELPRASTGKKQDTVKKISIVIKESGTMTINGKKGGFRDIQGFITDMKKQNYQLQAIISADRRTQFQKVVSVIDFLQLNGVEKFAINVEIVTIDEQ